MLTKWVGDNTEGLIGYRERLVLLAPYIRGGVLWGHINGLIRVSIDGVEPVDLRLIRHPEVTVPFHAEVSFLGRWFAGERDLSTLMAILGM